MKQQIKTIFYPIINSLALLFFTVLLFGGGLVLLFNSFGWTGTFSMFLSSQIAILAYFLSLYNFKFQEVKELFKIPKLKDVGFISIGLIAMVVINLSIGFSIKIFNLDTKSLDKFTANNAESIMSTGGLALFIPILLAPIFEELAFRAGLKNVLVDKGNWKPIYYVIFSSILFGLLHLQLDALTIYPFIIATLIGVLNSLLYLRTKNIFVPIITHALYNLFVLILV